MAPNLKPGIFKILSRTEGNPPIGVNLTLPAVQPIRLNEPVRQWVFRRGDDHKYRLSIGGYPYTGVIDNKVVGSIHSKHEVAWDISYREHHDTYTITRADDPNVGWTIVGDEVEIQPIRATHSLPPQFTPIQLFEFERFE